MIDYEKRAMIEAEDKYTFRQSSQISSQTGLIGYLRADMDTDGNGFFSSWNDYRKDLKTDEFKQEFDEVINSLREEGDILHNRKDLAYYCYTNPQSKMPTEQDYYGVRVDTDKYTYLLRLNPNKGEYNLYSSFDKEEWAAQKKQEREDAFALIDTTAEHMANDGALFQSYLDVQAHFDRYSVGNALLITAQKPEATQLADSKSWRENGVYIKKGEVGIVLLEPGEEFTKEDGSVGVSYNSKKVFDISQTNAKPKDRGNVRRDDRLLLKALIHNAPCPIKISQEMPEGINAVYRPQDKMIFVRGGLEAPDLFRGLSQELAHAHLDKGDYKRSDNAFVAYCASYVLCSRNNLPKDMFRFDRLPENMSTMDARSVRTELSKIRDVSNVISADMAKVLDKNRQPVERRDEAR